MQYANVIVTIRLAERTGQGLSPEVPESTRTYQALIYTALPALRTAANVEPPLGVPAVVGGCPLASIESLVFPWDRYQEYLAQFLVERKSASSMARRLIETMSVGLERLFGSTVNAGEPIRVWWNTEALELDDFPWELVAYTDKGPLEIERFSFVRGLPPEVPASIVPLDDGAPLRLTVMTEPGPQSDAFVDAITGIPGLEVTRLSGPAREMLQQAAVSDCELLHIVCDGTASLAYDGILHFSATDTELTAHELAISLRGTRMVFLGLSTTYLFNSDPIQIAGHQVPSVYRAFAYLAGADLPLPTILAPLAPAERAAAIDFWRTFYSQLRTTLSIEQAVADARKGPAPNFWQLAVSRFSTALSSEPAVVDPLRAPPLPVALFLRHTQERQFRRGLPVASFDIGLGDTPMVLGAELETSQRLVRRLQNIAGHKVHTGLRDFLSEETMRQGRISDQLASWTKLDKL